MKIIYDEKREMYLIQISDEEAETWIDTNDIVEAREKFIEQMIWLFNQTICDSLKNNDCVDGTISAHSICYENGKLYTMDT